MPLSSSTSLGPYEILAPLGAGGMGEVYRAKDTRLDRDVAVKVLPEHLASDPEALKRFEREAKSIAALSHPNILAIYDVGTAPPASPPHTKGEPRGVSYVVMELLEGETLRERVRRSAIPWRKAVEHGVAIAEGLAAAHARGIIHRDLKPENIFLTSDGVVKILDFGLARMVAAVGGPPLEDQADTPTITLDTKPGAVLGTPGYMSPEQISAQATDVRTDVFSFGCVLYETLTGNRAFAGKSMAEITTAILRDEPGPIADSGQAVPVELERLIWRCLEKKPEHRLQSARDLAFALRDILMDSTLAKHAREEAKSKSARLPWALIGGSAVALVVILTVWQSSRSPRPQDQAITSLAVLPFRSVGGDPETEYLSDEVPASIIDDLSRLSGLRVVPRSTAFRHEGDIADPTTVGRKLKVEAILTGRITTRGDTITIHPELIDVVNDRQIWGAKYRRELVDLLVIEEDIAKHISHALRLRITAEDRAHLAKRYTDNAEAYRAYLQGRFWWNKRTAEGSNKAIEFFDEAIRVDPTYALAYAGKAATYCVMAYYTHRPGEVVPLAREAAEAATRLDPTLAEAYAPLGMVHLMYDWDWEAAEDVLRRAIDLDPEHGTAHQWYAVLLSALGRFDEAEREISRARELDPGSLIINHDWAATALARRDFAAAQRRARRAVEMDPGFAPTRRLLGSIYLCLRRYDEAIAEFRKVIDLEGHAPRYAGWLGYACGLAGRRAEARAELRILNARSSQGEYVPAGAFALLHAGLGDFDSAFQWLDKACDERDNDLPFIKFAPTIDPLRSDARFDALVARLGLPPDPPAPVVPPWTAVKTTPRKIMLAVLPFDDLSPEPQEWFSDGLSEEMIVQLGRLKPGALGVIARTSAMYYKGIQKTIHQIGRELDVDYVVEGSVRRVGENLRITTKLIRVSDQTHIWSEDFNRTAADVLAIQSDVSQRVAEALVVELLPAERARLSTTRSVIPEAHEAYLKGRYYFWKFTVEDCTKAVEYFQQALDHDPDYALAFAGLADAYWQLGHPLWAMPPAEAMSQARTMALKALELDNTLADAHVSLGLVEMFYDWDFAGASGEFRRAIELNPSHSFAHSNHSASLLASGQIDEAIAAAERAQRHDPFNLPIRVTLGEWLWVARRYQEAEQQLYGVLELDPSYSRALTPLAWTHEQCARFDEAISAYHRAGWFSKEEMATFRAALATEGPPGYWRRWLVKLKDESLHERVSASQMAVVHAAVGEEDQAFEWLKRAYRDREGFLPFLGVNPRMDPLRKDPRFDDLLRRVGLEPSSGHNGDEP